MQRRFSKDLGINVSDTIINHAVEANRKQKSKRALDKALKYNIFVRKGIAGDWQNHYNDGHIRVFKDIAGDTLFFLGYERNLI